MPDQLIELLDEMLASAEKATKGPWRVEPYNVKRQELLTIRADVRDRPVPLAYAELVADAVATISMQLSSCRRRANANLMASSRTTLPAVLAALKVAVETNRRVLDQLQTYEHSKSQRWLSGAIAELIALEPALSRIVGAKQ